jgi:hypothetical protein
MFWLQLNVQPFRRDAVGARSTSDGLGFIEGRVLEDLGVIGSLRKADVWESTAVPELRLQAAIG